MKYKKHRDLKLCTHIYSLNERIFFFYWMKITSIWLIMALMAHCRIQSNKKAPSFSYYLWNIVTVKICCLCDNFLIAKNNWDDLRHAGIVLNVTHGQRDENMDIFFITKEIGFYKKGTAKTNRYAIKGASKHSEQKFITIWAFCVFKSFYDKKDKFQTCVFHGPWTYYKSTKPIIKWFSSSLKK